MRTRSFLITPLLLLSPRLTDIDFKVHLCISPLKRMTLTLLRDSTDIENTEIWLTDTEKKWHSCFNNSTLCSETRIRSNRVDRTNYELQKIKTFHFFDRAIMSSILWRAVSLFTAANITIPTRVTCVWEREHQHEKKYLRVFKTWIFPELSQSAFVFMNI